MPEAGQPGKRGGVLSNAPDEVVPSSAQTMQGHDAKLEQEFFHDPLDGRLHVENPLRLEESLCRMVEIDIFDIEIRDQRQAIPQRPANVDVPVKEFDEITDRQRAAVLKIGSVARREIVATRARQAGSSRNSTMRARTFASE